MYNKLLNARHTNTTDARTIIVQIIMRTNAALQTNTIQINDDPNIFTFPLTHNFRQSHKFISFFNVFLPHLRRLHSNAIEIKYV